MVKADKFIGTGMKTTVNTSQVKPMIVMGFTWLAVV